MDRKGHLVTSRKDFEMRQTLESLLRMMVHAKDKDGNDIEISPEFRVAVQHINDEGVHVIIHPFGYSGDTLDFLVIGNDLKAI